jgi:osmotically-inducible protein OsmY
LRHIDPTVLQSSFPPLYPKNAAAYVIRNLSGVKGVLNDITIEATAQPAAVEAKILDAFKRNALLDAARITVKVEGSKVFPEGEVRSRAERDQANDAAWYIPAIVSVIDHLTISESIFA